MDAENDIEKKKVRRRIKMLTFYQSLMDIFIILWSVGMITYYSFHNEKLLIIGIFGIFTGMSIQNIRAAIKNQTNE